MGIIIVLIVLLINLLFKDYSDWYYLDNKALKTKIKKYNIIFICLLTLFTTLSVITTAGEKKSKVIHSYDIYSLNREFGASGSFFLGCGTIDSKIYYVVTRKNGIGYYQEKVNESEVFFVESDTETPRVDTVIEYKENMFFEVMFDFSFYYNRYCIIYVPVGTIIVNYDIS